MDGGRKGRLATASALEWTVLCLLLAGLLLALRNLPVRAALERATLWIESLGWWAPAAFVVLYVLCTLLLVPRTVLTVAAGFLFGFGWGAVLALLSINLGANLAFFSGRHFIRSMVERRARHHPRFLALDRAVGRDGWRIVALTRLTPVFPYSLLNYAFGLTQVAWPQFVAGSFLGMLPGTLILVALGTLTDFATEQSEAETGTWLHAATLAAMAAAVVSTFVVGRFAKRALARNAGTELS